MTDQTIPEPGTPEAYWAAGVQCSRVADKYREAANELAALSDRIRRLTVVTVLDPEMGEPDARPALLRSDVAQYDVKQTVDRIERSVVHLHGRAGVWDAQAHAHREEGTRLTVADPA